MRLGGVLVLGVMVLVACAGQSQQQPAQTHPFGGIAVGSRPGVVVLGAGAAWVPNTGDGTLTKIDQKSNRVLATWRIGDPASLRAQGCTCYSVHQCPNGTFRVRKCDVPSVVAFGAGSVWVPRNDRKSLLRLDPRTGKLLAEIQVGAVVWDLAATDSGVWLTDYFGSKLIHIDPATNRVVAEIDDFPVGAGNLLPLGPEVWVSAVNAGELIDVDAHNNIILARVPVLAVDNTYVGPQPLSLVYAKGSIWTRNNKAASLSRIDPATRSLVATYPVDAFFGRDGIDAMAVQGDHLWLGGVRMQCFDLTRLAVTSRAPQIAAAVSSGGDGTLWVTDLGDRVEHLAAPPC